MKKVKEWVLKVYVSDWDPLNDWRFWAGFIIIGGLLKLLAN